MIGLLQRVTSASVAVGGETVAEIGRGLLVLVGVQRGDTRAQAARLLFYSNAVYSPVRAEAAEALWYPVWDRGLKMGYAVVTLNLPLGDLSSHQALALAEINTDSTGPWTFTTGPPLFIVDLEPTPADSSGELDRVITLSWTVVEESDLGDGWEDEDVHDDLPGVREEALRMGVNLFVYALGQAVR